MADNRPDPSRLRYLSCNHVEVPLPSDHLDVRDREDRRIGSFDGVIIDPAAHQLRYIVVDAPGLFRHQRRLLPIDPTRVDAEHRALRVDLDSADVARCQKFDRRAFPAFSDEDLMDVLFPDREAATSNHVSG